MPGGSASNAAFVGAKTCDFHPKKFLASQLGRSPRQLERVIERARSAVRKRAVFDARRRCNTVNGPSPDRVSTRSAAVSAAVSVENSGAWDKATSTIVCEEAAEIAASATRSFMMLAREPVSIRLRYTTFYARLARFAIS